MGKQKVHPETATGVKLDITERQLGAEAAVDAANRARAEFLAILSHELRTPLAPAFALVQMLQLDESLAPEHRGIVAEIGRHIQAISGKIVELHDGTLTTASPGGGRAATLPLRLTATGAARAAAEPQEAALPSAEPPGADRPLKILLMDDHPSTARALARLLRSHGHTVLITHSLAAAERAVAAERFDLLLCDLILPDGLGFDFLPRIRHHLQRWAAGGAEAPAIVLSSLAQKSDVARSLTAGYVAHLAKPVEQAELLAAIRRATASREPHDEVPEDRAS